jgi:putative endonuclease
MASYFVYILECADGTLYAGSTSDIEKRLEAHIGRAPGGARYTRGRRPVVLRYSEACSDRSTALKREHALKSLTRLQKLGLIK